MPELPEVETICRQLQREIKGATIKEVVVGFAKRLNVRPSELNQRLKSKKILGVERRAKLIIIKINGGSNLLIHLKLTGRLLIKKADDQPSKHTHVIFKLINGLELHFEDARKFGFIKLLDDRVLNKFIEKQNYGPEPLSRSFTWQKFFACLRSRSKSKIKLLLLEQSCLAGLGNIYATEALWAAKIHPLTPIGKIPDSQLKVLYRSIIRLLKSAIRARGSSLDSYLDAYGRPGLFVSKHQVYGRVGKKCRRCGATIQSIKIGGRGSAFCPKCQHRPTS